MGCRWPFPEACHSGPAECFRPPANRSPDSFAATTLPGRWVTFLPSRKLSYALEANLLHGPCRFLRVVLAVRTGERSAEPTPWQQPAEPALNDHPAERRKSRN